MGIYWDYSKQQYCAQIEAVPTTAATRNILRPMLLGVANDAEAVRQGKALFEDATGAIWKIEAEISAKTAAKTKAEIESTAKSWAEAEEFSKAFVQDLMRPEVKAVATESAKAIVRDLFAADQD